MNLLIERYVDQSARWPSDGRAILAHHDQESVIVYQAYRQIAGQFAASNGFFGTGFSRHRMTWIKPNFLWMMYRSKWGTAEGQRVVLAVRLRRAAFDEILSVAVHSSYQSKIYSDETDWSGQLANSDVRLQWDPDRDPSGASLSRRAIQIGLRGNASASYARPWIMSIEDISGFVAEQRAIVEAGLFDELLTPSETVYRVSDPSVAKHLGIAKARP